MELELEDKLEEICGICGNLHQISTCDVIKMEAYVQDSIVLSKARLTLPSVLKIEKMSEGSNLIIAAEFIKEEPNLIFTSNDYFSEYYLDTNNEDECNWMMFVPPAQNLIEQNLICYQDDSKIFFMSIRDISVGEYLKVWYSPFYGQKMNKNMLSSPKKLCVDALDLNMLLKKQQNLMERDVWTCKFCNHQEKDVTKFATHISQHYTMQVRKACEICKSAFMTHKGLKKHIKIVHANKTGLPINDNIENSQQIKKRKNDIKDTMVGGPLLNDMLTDSMDNTNLLLQQTDISRFDMHNDILLDNDNLNLVVENYMPDDDNFNFNINEDKEEHICDICLKPFAKLKRLVQHLQKHTGKYACPECLVIFSRNENLQAHKCNLYKKQQYKCTLCDKKFALKKYLSRHMQSVHERKRSCSKCNKTYHSEKECKEHNCPEIPDSEKEKYPCLHCNKTFFRESYIKRHMKLHSPIKQPVTVRNEFFICEMCAKTFKTARNLSRHKKTHTEISFPCDKCDKSFTRSDSLNHHKIVEHCSFSYPCPVCDKEYKSKKYLRLHMTTHVGSKKYQCSVCNRRFFQQSTMLKHFRLKHAVNCNKCNRDDCVHTQTLVECYECPVCKRLLKLRSSVMRHLKKNHPCTEIDSDKIKKVRRMWRLPPENKLNVVEIPGCDDKMEDLLNADNLVNERDNLDDNVGKMDTASIEDKGSNANNIMDFNNLTLELGKDLAINSQEICLSMPELTEMEQDVTLSDNAYVLDNGTIVEPLDSQNIVVYIFDKK
ncbi:zinc finger and btb domain-containing [Holotrichia oblita]|uniref:Zinc finger and btb domain-containing n=1 Tax=Holotrichia oblita TaxID=644536 RepID=A0ACB9TCH4_HOLOL|nr:zinc finger and btb domain-containing [Holotrichia oblita]